MIWYQKSWQWQTRNNQSIYWWNLIIIGLPYIGWVHGSGALGPTNDIITMTILICIPLVYISSCRWRHFTFKLYVGHYFYYTSAGFSHSILGYWLKQFISRYSGTCKRMTSQGSLMKFVLYKTMQLHNLSTRYVRICIHVRIAILNSISRTTCKWILCGRILRQSQWRKLPFYFYI